MLNETSFFSQLEGQSHSSNHETIDVSVTCKSDCNMEEPVDVTTNVSKKEKPAVESVVPANLNKTNGDCLARKLFGTPDSKELLMQVHLKVTLVVVLVVVAVAVIHYSDTSANEDNSFRNHIR